MRRLVAGRARQAVRKLLMEGWARRRSGKGRGRTVVLDHKGFARNPMLITSSRQYTRDKSAQKKWETHRKFEEQH